MFSPQYVNMPKLKAPAECIFGLNLEKYGTIEIIDIIICLDNILTLGEIIYISGYCSIASSEKTFTLMNLMFKIFNG